jgi:hypothetical protein
MPMTRVESRVPLLESSRSHPSEGRIDSLPDVRRYIEELDLSKMRDRLMAGPEELGQSWNVAKADYYQRLYRNWLYVCRKHESETLAPQVEIDCCWHEHILDTRVYFRDCDRIFGYYFHHFPGFGKRGPEDARNLQTAWQTTQARYLEEYGDYIYDFEE